MRQKIIFPSILLTSLGAVLLLLGTLNSWSAQATTTKRYVALQSACGSKSPCYPNIQAAVDDSTPGDEILVTGGTYTGVHAVATNGSVYTQALFIDKDITIRGGFTTTTWAKPDPTTYPTILDAQSPYLRRVVYLADNITVTLEGLMLTNGRADYDYGIAQGGGVFIGSSNVTISNCQIISNTGIYGAGIFNNGVLTLTNDIIRDNYGSAPVAWGDSGGGIYNMGDMNINLTTIISNSANSVGGIANDGKMKISASTISHNKGDGPRSSGGGIGNGGILDMVDSTVIGNSSIIGGGIYNLGHMTITNSTVSYNWSPSSIAGIANMQGTLVVRNSTIVSNTSVSLELAGGIHSEDIFSLGEQPVLSITNSIVAHNPISNCIGVITSFGHNLEDNSSCDFTAAGDLSNTSPMLDKLDYHGGPTLVYGLLNGSPAIDHGDNSACPTTDQRGLPRPQGTGCDIGAFELETFSQYLPYLLNQHQ